MLPFWRFPISLLAYDPEDTFKTLMIIRSYCFLTVGEKTTEEITLKDILFETRLDGGDPNNIHYTTAKGASVMEHYASNTGDRFAEATAALEYLKQPDTRQGPTTTLRNDLFLRTFATADPNYSGQARRIPWRDFRVLCALLSKIGTKGTASCGWREIQARAAGWPGKLAMKNAAPEELTRRKSLILTHEQIRNTIDNLESMNFFCRVVYRARGKKGGQSWYSFSHTRRDLVNLIVNKKHRKPDALASKRGEDSSFIATALKKRADVSTNASSSTLKKFCPKQTPKSQQTRPNTSPNPTPNINERSIYNKKRIITKEGRGPGAPLEEARSPSFPEEKEKQIVQQHTETLAQQITTNTQPEPPPPGEPGFLIDGTFHTSSAIQTLLVNKRDNPKYIEYVLTNAKPARLVNGEVVMEEKKEVKT